MKKYQALINGTNFLIEINGVLEKYGFYTNRYVEANDISEAENLAIDLIRKNDDIRVSIKNIKNDTPMMYIEEIYEVENFNHVESFEEGLAWYKENESIEEAESKDIYEAHITNK